MTEDDIELSENEIRHWLEVMYQRLINENLLDISYEKFEVDFDLMGCQRHLKAIGIFSRLNYRDNKDNYLQDIPRTYSYIEKTLKKYKDLTNLNEIFSDLNLLEKISK